MREAARDEHEINERYSSDTNSLYFITYSDQFDQRFEHNELSCCCGFMCLTNNNTKQNK